ncbi:hypothetical protein [uncultured Gordonia sp.]|uniref:hypothetical protein n=1 Tax=uncultured Gordonia sp. TaxID=198437 RepID=UPI0025869EFA|nr:hypothetical protein [uncultured Gordonia sp.]
MSSPHDRDGRFYGYNEDPYTRDPYRDAYTGYPGGGSDGSSGEYSTGSAAAEPTPIARAKPFLDSEPTDRRRGGQLVPPGKFIGGVVVSGSAACILAWLLAGFVVPGVYSVLERAGQWTHTLGIDTPSGAPADPATGVWVMLTAAAAIIAGAGLWLLVQIAPAPVMFFRVLAALLSVAALVVTWSSGPTAVTLAPAIAAGVIGLAITLGVGWCGAYVSTGR